jgi:dienelactone hydrolase
MLKRGAMMNLLKNKFFKAILIFIIVITLLFTAFYIYTLDYYKANAEAVGALTQSSEIAVSKQSEMFVFEPKGNSKSVGFIFYPGGKVEYTAYAPLMKAIAKQGYTCVLLKMPFNLAVFDVNGANRAMKKLKDINSWYVGGHSLGGAMASAYAAGNADKLKGIVFLGAYPSSNLSKTNLKMLSVYGSEDKVLNKKSFEENKKNAPKNVEYFEIAGGNHAYYGAYGEQKGDGKATISPANQQEIVANKIVELMNS